MDKNAATAISDLEKKIQALQEKKEAVIKKEKERKAKAQEKWKAQFLKEMVRGISGVFGPDYEENLSAEDLAGKIRCFLEEGMKPAGTDENAGGHSILNSTAHVASPSEEEEERRHLNE